MKKKPLIAVEETAKQKLKTKCTPNLALELTSKFNNKTSPPTRIPPTPIKSSAWFPENLIEICEFILNSNNKKMKKPSFVFEMCPSALFQLY